ncbi:polysaccharide pyruvyl transferase family protein [Chitinophaga silvatica]|uniref:Polysaccharide pyruvyl transferase family protein n=1 Tax=Chitinophaga silvatica TaxID=2282649 RepID=A0A3E1Y9C4_9BACT|nr:polysaccharide pyruvyl transferase family protein [Chitinophaga silvatica]RFS22018.1 polysaccharide pyruvyl transferase family protein [Chitinophaga silvatica]
MKRALIVNEGFSNNLGDQAIRESVTNLLQDGGYTTDFAYFTNPAISQLPVYNYLNSQPVFQKELSALQLVKLKFSRWYWIAKNYNAIVNRLKKGNYDLVVIGGGQLIESSRRSFTSRFAIAMDWWTDLIKKHSNAKIWLIGVGVGTSFNDQERKHFSNALSRIDIAWVRDAYSQSVLKDQFGLTAILTPDIAFYNSKNSNVAINSNRKALVGVTSYQEVFVRYNKNGKTKAEYFEEWYSIVRQYELQGLTVELFYTTITDAVETLAFKEYVESEYGRELSVAAISTVSDLKALYQTASDVYAGRMHALILAMKHQCKVKPYLISQKLKSFSEEYIVPEMSMEYSHKIRRTFNDLIEDC